MRVALFTTAIALCACVGVVQLPPQPPDAPRLDVFSGQAPPELQTTDVPGLLAAPELGPTVYYYEPGEYWCRFARNRWYMAFSWDGNWFDLPDDELPTVLAQRHKPPPPKAVKDELAELERQLEALEGEQPASEPR